MILLAVACAVPEDRASETCGGCHPAELAAWRATGHARSGDDDVFRAWLPEVRRAWGEAAERRCEACHTPGFGGDEEDVGCLACHGAVGNRGTADGALVVDENGPIGAPGPLPDDAPHALTRRAFLGSSDLCATCHEVTGPGLLDERTGTEHAASGTGPCASCHLPGGDHDLRPRWDGALELRLHADGDGLTVDVTNVGAGHDVPTGAAFLRDLAVDLVLVHADGDAEEVPAVLELAPVPVRDGVPVPLPTDGDAIAGRGLARGETRSTTLDLPDDVVRVEASAVLRRFRPDLLDELGLPDDTGGGPQVVATAALDR